MTANELKNRIEQLENEINETRRLLNSMKKELEIELEHENNGLKHEELF